MRYQAHLRLAAGTVDRLDVFDGVHDFVPSRLNGVCRRDARSRRAPGVHDTFAREAHDMTSCAPKATRTALETVAPGRPPLFAAGHAPTIRVATRAVPVLLAQLPANSGRFMLLRSWSRIRLTVDDYPRIVGR